MSHWFGITWDDIYVMPAYELGAYEAQLAGIRRSLEAR